MCWFQVSSNVSHLYTHIQLLLFSFFSHIGHYEVLHRVPHAIQ